MSLTLSLPLKTHTNREKDRQGGREEGGERRTLETVTAASQLTTGSVKHRRSIMTVITGHSRHARYMYSDVMRASG